MLVYAFEAISHIASFLFLFLLTIFLSFVLFFKFPHPFFWFQCTGHSAADSARRAYLRPRSVARGRPAARRLPKEHVRAAAGDWAPFSGGRSAAHAGGHEDGRRRGAATNRIRIKWRRISHRSDELRGSAYSNTIRSGRFPLSCLALFWLTYCILFNSNSKDKKICTLLIPI